MMSKKSPWISFWPVWTLANGLGWLAASVIFVLPFWGFGAAVGIGFFISWLQWLVLSRYVGVDFMWLWLSIPAYGIFLFAIRFLGSGISFFTLLAADVICLGLLGFLQCIPLNYALERSMAWVWVSPLAGAAGIILSMLLSNLTGNGSPAFFWGILGIIYGCITGIAIIALKGYTARNSRAGDSGA